MSALLLAIKSCVVGITATAFVSKLIGLYNMTILDSNMPATSKSLSSLLFVLLYCNDNL
jgi:hypothetical protein